MNREETKKAIEVMQAFVDGKTIEYCDLNPRGAWVTARTPIWNFIVFGYRIKREPREFVVLVKDNDQIIGGAPLGSIVIKHNREDELRLCKTIRVREIIDDQD